MIDVTRSAVAPVSLSAGQSYRDSDVVDQLHAGQADGGAEGRFRGGPVEVGEAHAPAHEVVDVGLDVVAGDDGDADAGQAELLLFGAVGVGDEATLEYVRSARDGADQL